MFETKLCRKTGGPERNERPSPRVSRLALRPHANAPDLLPSARRAPLGPHLHARSRRAPPSSRLRAGMFGKSDPYLVFKRQVPDGGFVELFKTEARAPEREREREGGRKERERERERERGREREGREGRREGGRERDRD